MTRLTPIILLLLLAGGMPVSSSSSPEEPILVPGPQGPGYVVVLVEPVDEGEFYVEAVWEIGPKSVVGSITYNPYEREDNTGYVLDGGNRIGGQRVYVNNELTGNHEVRRDWSSPPRETRMGHPWWVEPHGFIFFATGNTTRFDVYVYGGTVLDSAVGEDAIAVFMEDVPENSYRANVRPHGPGATITSRSTTTFEMAGPFFADVRGGGSLNPLGRVSVEAPDGTRQACACFLTPNDTVAGRYTVEAEGYLGDDVLFWAVAAPVLLIE